MWLPKSIYGYLSGGELTGDQSKQINDYVLKNYNVNLETTPYELNPYTGEISILSSDPDLLAPANPNAYNPNTRTLEKDANLLASPKKEEIGSFANQTVGSLFDENSWLNNPNAQSAWDKFGNALGGLTFGDIGKGIFGGLGLYNGFQQAHIANKQLGLAEDTFNFNKDAYYRNLGNQISDYNARIEDLGNTRYKMTGDSKYLEQADSRKLHL